MADVTGGIPPTNASPFAVPDDITAVYDHFGDQAQFSVATAASLPGSDNWVGRTVFVVDTATFYVWSGSAWLRRQAPYAIAVGSQAITGPAGTTITFPAGRFTVAPVIVGTVTAAAGGAVSVPWITGITSSSCLARIFTLGSASISGTIEWTAIQMLSGSAAG